MKLLRLLVRDGSGATVLTGVAMMGALVVPHEVQANGVPGANSEIIVTAPSADDRVSIKDSPINAQVLRGRDLTRQQPSNLADLLNDNLGGVSISNGSGSPFQNDIAYRGFQATSQLGAATGLSVYFDGVAMNDPFGANVNWDVIPMNVISEVEVLPGSNPVFGLNTLGGALVLTTTNGAKSPGLSLMAQGGSFGRWNGQFSFGGTFDDKAFDWLFAGNFDRQNSWRLYSGQRVAQGFGKLRWHGADAHAALSVIWADTSLHGTQGLPLEMLATPWAAYTAPDDNQDRALVVNFKAGARLARAIHLSANFYGRRASTYTINSNASEDALSCLQQGGSPYDCTRVTDGGSALNLDNHNGFAPGSAQYANFLPYSGALPISDYNAAIDTSLVDSGLQQKSFGGNVLLDFDRSVLGLDNDFNLGGSFEISAIDYNQSTWLAQLVNTQTIARSWNTRYASASGFQGSPLISSLAVNAHNSAANLFVRDTLKPTSFLAITGSLAYTGTRVSLHGVNQTFLEADGGYSWLGSDGVTTWYNPAYLGANWWNTPAIGASSLAIAGVPLGGVAGPEIDPVSGAHIWQRVNPSLGLAWNSSTSWGLFANYSEAMRAPTAIELACADPARPCTLPTGFNGDPNLDAVIAHTIEGGARGTFGQHLHANADIYRTLLTNDIQFIFAPSGAGWFANVGRTEREGYDLTLSADWPHWHFSASYSHVVARFLAGFTDASGDVVAPGDRIAGIPEDTFKLNAVWSPTRKIQLGANWVTASSQFSHGDEANLYGAVPGYMVVNLDAHYHVSSKFELFSTVSNLFGAAYATFGVMGTNIYTAMGDQFRTPAAPRALMFGLRYGMANADAPND